MGMRLKLLVPMILVMVCIVFFVNRYLFQDYVAREKASFDNLHVALLKGVALHISPYVEAGDVKHIGDLLDSYTRPDYGLLGAVITDLNGRVLYKNELNFAQTSVNRIDIEVMSGGVHVADARFYIDESLYLTEVFHGQQRLEYLLLGVFLLAFFVIFIFQDLFIRKPLKRLLNSVNSLAYGDFDADIKVSSNDEIGELAASIKMMQGNIRAFQRSLKEKTIKANDLAETLYEGQHRMQAIIDNVAHGIVVTNEQAIIESVNKSLCLMLGYSEDELIAQNITIFIPGKYKNQHLHGMQRFIETGVSKIIGKGVNELEVMAKNGDVIPVDVAITSMVVGGKRYFNAVMSNVTERKQAEMTLRKERDRAQRYLDTVEVIVVALDLNGKVKLINRKGLEIVGGEEADVVGVAWRDICIRAHEREAFDLFLADQFDPNKKFVSSAESLIVSDSLGEKIILWRYSLLHGDDGAISGLLCSGGDITESRAIERERESIQRQLQQSQKMQAIGQLTGGIAHDFNNIIASIIGHTELLMMREELCKDERTSRYLENIYRSGERAKDLVDKMLAFSRGRSKDAPVVIDVESVVQEVINILRSILPASMDINVTFSGEGIGVLASPIDLQQVIMNLCINARDAMSGAGSLDVAVSKESDIHHLECSSCHQEVDGSYIVISVSDTGVGITSSEIGRLFEPFFTTKEVGKGTGMGLPVVHGIVHDLGGHIVVTSTPGEGACFRVYLRPAVVGLDNVDPGEVGVHVASGDGRVVLVVDDESLVREFVCELLKEDGYTVYQAAEPMEALEFIKAKHSDIDVIISDLSMPGMTGVQMSRIISAMYPGIPIILCTGYSDDYTVEEIKDAGIKVLMTKPMKGDELLMAIDRVISETEPLLVSRGD